MEVYVAVPIPQSSLPSSTDTFSPTASAQMAPTPSTTVAYGPIGSGLTITTAGPTSSEDGATETNFPSAITVTTIKYGEVVQRSQGCRGVPPGFGFIKWPALEGFTASAALVSFWIMASGVL